MICPYCKRPAKWVENKEIYGKNYGKSYMMWLCKPCDAYVGCHNNTKEPLGTLANKVEIMVNGYYKKQEDVSGIWKDGE